MTPLVSRPAGEHHYRERRAIGRRKGESVNYLSPQSRVSILPHAMEWIRTTPAENPELRKSPRPVIAQWHGELPTCVVILFEDGTIHTDGEMPIELLPYVQAEWHVFMRGKVA
jgi:hypothetical protein